MLLCKYLNIVFVRNERVASNMVFCREYRALYNNKLVLNRIIKFTEGNNDHYIIYYRKILCNGELDTKSYIFKFKNLC